MKNDVAAIDRQALLRFLEDIGGDKEALAEILREYLADAPRLVQQLERAVGSGDVAALAGAAHTLKGTSAAIGAVPLTALCTQLDRQVRAGTVASAGALSAQIVAELARLRALLLPAGAPDQGIDIDELIRRIA